METLEALGRRIATTEDLAGIVRTMKTLSAVSIRQYEHATAALREYARTVELALQAVLRDRPAPTRPERAASGTPVIVVFGSDHGLCGRFNDDIARFAADRLRELDVTSARRRCLAVGARVDARLAALGEPVDATLSLPASVSGLTSLAQAVVIQIDAWSDPDGLGRVLLMYSRRTPQAVAVPRVRQLLPLSAEYLQSLATRRWPSRRLPMVTMDTQRLFSTLVRQHLFSVVYRAAAESLASEHASRLAAMQAAERSIEDHLEAQHARFRQRRQETITEELLDIVSGFEASGHAAAHTSRESPP